MFQNSFKISKQVRDLTITIIGFVEIFLALAAYLKVFNVSLAFERAGETQAI